MTSDWQTALTQFGAHWQEQRVTHFSDADRERAAIVNGSIVTDLSHYGLIGVRGTDSESFLQNQTANDVRLVNAEQHQFNCYCSPKGRMLANFRLFQRDADYFIRLPVERLAAIVQRLRMFVLRAKVELFDASEQIQRLGIAGPAASAALKHSLSELIDSSTVLPAAVDNAITADQITVLRVPGEQRFEVYAPADIMVKLWPLLSAQLTPVGSAAWPLLDILNGIPTIYNATTEHFVPQMANMRQINGISFQKGCYPGQEVVARMQYLGKLKRRMYLVELTTATAPTPGSVVVAVTADNDKPQTVGEIVDAALHPDGHSVGLAVLQTSHKDHDLRLADPANATLQLQALPYALDDDGNSDTESNDS